MIQFAERDLKSCSKIDLQKQSPSKTSELYEWEIQNKYYTCTQTKYYLDVITFLSKK